MADIISRLKLETGGFNANIKRAGQELLAYSEHCRKTGLQMGFANRDAKEFARQLGSMATQSHTARGKINELTETFTNLKVMYNSMTEAEKKGEFGKILSGSLEQLKTRIGDASSSLKEVQGELSGGLSDALNKVAGKFGLNISQLTGWGAALAAGTTALKVAKDAFFASEATVDEWGRVVASSQSLYEGFLNAINTGDISGYLSRIDQITAAAKRAYDELDRLGTMKTIQSPAKSAQESENQRMRMMLMTGSYIAKPGTYSPAGLKDGDRLSKAQLRKIEQQLKNGTKRLVELNKREVEQSNKAINAYYDKLAAQSGISASDFRKGTSSWSEFEQRIKGAEAYNKFENEHTIVQQTYNPTLGDYVTSTIRDNVANPYKKYRGWDVFRVDKMGENSYNDLVGLIQQRDQQLNSMYQQSAQAYRTINRVEGITPRGILSGGTSGGGGSTKTATREKEKSISQQISELTEKAMRTEGEELNIIKAKIRALMEEEQKRQDLKKSIQSSIKLDIEFDKQLEMPIKPVLDEKGMNDILANAEQRIKGMNIPDQGKKAKESWKDAAAAVSSVGDAMQNIDDPSAKIVGLIGEAIANIALGFAQATAKDTKLGVFGWIAAIAGGLGTMISTISAIHSSTGYAEGGLVRGNTYSNDQIPAYLNAGEVVLNAAQSGNLASALTGMGAQNMRLTATVTGEQLRLVLNNNARRTGRGETLMFK